MNFISEYFEIIGNRLLNPLPVEVKGERHHIFPKSIGGSNNKSNIVKLTLKEHYRCHELLVEMFRDNDENAFQRMLYAWNQMRGRVKDLDNPSEAYAKLKRAFSEICSERMHKQVPWNKGVKGTGGGFKGKHHSDEAKKKISAANKGRPVPWKGKPSLMKGKHLSEETRRKLSIAHKGKHLSEEHKRLLSERGKGRIQSERSKELRRQAMKAYWAKRKAAQHLQS